MSRRMGVVWSKAQAAAGAPLPHPVEVDSYFDKVVRYMPAGPFLPIRYALVSALIDPSACERQLCGVASF